MATAPQTLDQALALRFKRILIATDFSEISLRALPFVIGLARHYGSEVFVVHATPGLREALPLEHLPQEMDRQRADAAKQMTNIVETAALKDVDHHLLIEKGPVADVLAWVVEEENIDLLVLGTHGRGGLKKLALGSVTEETLRLVPCPVLTIGQNVVPLTTEEPTFQRILFATDFGGGTAKALPLALALAQKHGARLILVHLVPPMPTVGAGTVAFGGPMYLPDELSDWGAKKKQVSVRKLLQLIPSDANLPFAPEYVVAIDSAPEGILSTASAHNVDLIVMGANRTVSAHAMAHMPWSVAHRVICEARCPVLTVRS